MLKIEDLQLRFPLVLAPLAGISDLPFRLINRSFGCELAFTEMISAKSLVYQNGNTLKMLETAPQDSPLAVQLLGNDPAVLRDAAGMLSHGGYRLMDLNAACPVQKVIAKGEGAALMNSPDVFSSSVGALVEASRVPVTVKIRSGWDEYSVNAPEIALRAQDAGASAVFIHGRTRKQGYSGVPDYTLIADIKRRLDIPVVASGDALTPRLVKKMLDETGCDGVVIARGALGNPWIFRDTALYLTDGIQPEGPDSTEVSEVMMLHLESCVSFYGERQGVVIFRKFYAWYSRGFSGTRALKEAAFRAETLAEMSLLVKEIAGKSHAGRIARERDLIENRTAYVDNV